MPFCALEIFPKMLIPGFTLRCRYKSEMTMWIWPVSPHFLPYFFILKISLFFTSLPTPCFHSFCSLLSVRYLHLKLFLPISSLWSSWLVLTAPSQHKQGLVVSLECFPVNSSKQMKTAEYQIINSLLNQHGYKYAKLVLLFQNQFLLNSILPTSE